MSAFYALVYPLWAIILVYYNVGLFFKNSGISIFEPSDYQLKYLDIAIYYGKYLNGLIPYPYPCFSSRKLKFLNYPWISLNVGSWLIDPIHSKFSFHSITLDDLNKYIFLSYQIYQG